MSTRADIHIRKGEKPAVETLPIGSVVILPNGITGSAIYLGSITDAETDAYLETMIAQCALMREQLWARAAVRTATEVMSELS